MKCPVGEICSAEGFTQSNLCVPIPQGSSVCGDGVLNTNEECERNGLGCDESTCTCKMGYYPSDPQNVDCLCTSSLQSVILFYVLIMHSELHRSMHLYKQRFCGHPRVLLPNDVLPRCKFVRVCEVSQWCSNKGDLRYK